MSFKTVYQLDEKGFYLGETNAQESPLEPGVYLIPRLCVEKAPPKCRAGYVPVYKFEERKWAKVKADQVVETESGALLISEEDAARTWRNAELFRADVIINRIEDFEIEGDSKAWRQYRVALRRWPEVEGFPIETSKPKAPDSE